MKLSVLTLQLVLSGVILATPLAATAAGENKTIAEATRSMTRQAGFMEVWRDIEQGRVLLSIPQQGEQFLMVFSLPHGLGSNDVGLDRGMTRGPKLVQFERRGKRIFLIEHNTGFRATSDNPSERASVVEAFAGAVLWSGDIIASEGGNHLVDFSSFLTADRLDVAGSLANSKQGAYRVDDKRSAVLAEQARSFPDNTELEAILTFQGPGEAQFVRQVAADAASITLRQHVSMVRLPDNAYRPRSYHPFSGAFEMNYMDFGTPLASSIAVRVQPRFRLEKTDPSAAVSTVKKPIVFYVDRGAPEPVRSALLEGARWWTSAFEKAGFKDAYRVEVLPEGVDPMDIRYNVIQWVHRATRGWSYGNAVADPRTGEIIKGAVTLGSQRVRQDILIAEALLAPYGKGKARAGLAEQMALARLRQLSAHEVGHTLGFAHNFAASLNGNGSVLDYPHPIVKLDASGEISIADAYGVGVGPWDDYVVKHAYGQFDPAAEAGELARLRATAKSAGMAYVSDNEARSTGAMHPNGVLWDFGADALQAWDQLMAVRARALRNFSVDILPDQRQMGEVEARLVPVYLMHRYQAEGLARLLGGGDFDYATSDDVRAGAARGGVRVVPAARQRQALERLAASLRAETLALPATVLDLVTPAATGFERGREYFATRMSGVFDPMSATEAAAAQTCQFLFDAARLNRMAWQHARDPQQPGLKETVDAVLERTWKRAPVPASVTGGEAVQASANWVVLDALLRLLDGGQLHPAQQAELRQQLAAFAQWLGRNPAATSAGSNRAQAGELIRKYLDDPSKVKLRPLPAVPPGAPI
ncbi:MAG: zinc-dependent metalloprotease [Pseudomonadota bacterium]